MKHAGTAALDALEPLLADLRSLAGLREKTRGVFYLRGRAFLHFHEDPAGLFADIRDSTERDFDRINVSDVIGQRRLFEAAKARLTASPTTAPPDR